MGFSERIDTNLNKMDTNRNVSFLPFATVPIVCSWFHQRWRDKRPKRDSRREEHVRVQDLSAKIESIQIRTRLAAHEEYMQRLLLPVMLVPGHVTQQVWRIRFRTQQTYYFTCALSEGGKKKRKQGRKERKERKKTQQNHLFAFVPCLKNRRRRSKRQAERIRERKE